MTSLLDAAAEAVIVSDLWSLKELIFRSGIGASLFYFKLEEGSFIRPSYFIKVVNVTVIPRHAGYRELQEAIMVQYFTEDYYDALVTQTALSLLLSGAPNFADIILPRYDFSQSPPQPISITGRDNSDGTLDPNCLMGARIDPTTITSSAIEEENRTFNVSFTFTVNSPVLRDITAPFMENITFEILTGDPLVPEVVKVCAKSESSVIIS